jgi:hypothetical protein
LRFQSTAQIVADRNMEIFNGSDVLEILQVWRVWNRMFQFDVFQFDARKKTLKKRSRVTRPN